MNFIDEEDRHRALGKRADDGLETFLEVAAEARACQQCAGVEREHLGAFEKFRHVVAQQSRREPFGQRGFPDARIAHEHGIVLPTPAEDLDRALQFVGAAD